MLGRYSSAAVGLISLYKTNILSSQISIKYQSK
jgi:hypothetical protein